MVFVSANFFLFLRQPTIFSTRVGRVVLRIDRVGIERGCVRRYLRCSCTIYIPTKLLAFLAVVPRVLGFRSGGWGIQHYFHVNGYYVSDLALGCFLRNYDGKLCSRLLELFFHHDLIKKRK